MPSALRHFTADELAVGCVIEHETGHQVEIVALGNRVAVGRRRERAGDEWGDEFGLDLGHEGDALGRWRLVTWGGAVTRNLPAWMETEYGELPRAPFGLEQRAARWEATALVLYRLGADRAVGFWETETLTAYDCTFQEAAETFGAADGNPDGSPYQRHAEFVVVLDVVIAAPADDEPED